jgi:hypothetical protein
MPFCLIGCTSNLSRAASTQPWRFSKAAISGPGSNRDSCAPISGPAQAAALEFEVDLSPPQLEVVGVGERKFNHVVTTMIVNFARVYVGTLLGVKPMGAGWTAPIDMSCLLSATSDTQ